MLGKDGIDSTGRPTGIEIIHADTGGFGRAAILPSESPPSLIYGTDRTITIQDRDLGGQRQATPLRVESAPRPEPDNRGVISYPNYQVAVARRGDTLEDVAARVGTDAAALARYNGLQVNDPLRAGEIIALPRRVAEPSPATGSPSCAPGSRASRLHRAGRSNESAGSARTAPSCSRT